jgi:hypothetical protein
MYIATPEGCAKALGTWIVRQSSIACTTLNLPHTVVPAIQLQQLLMSALLGYSSIMDNQDLIGLHDRRQAMSYHKSSPSVPQTTQGCLYRGLCDGINSTCCFVEYENWRVF